MQKRILNIFILVLVLNTGNCFASNDSTPTLEPEQLITGSSLLNHNYNTVLYKAGVDVYGRYFSGLFLFKQILADTSYRIVMLSEFGLSYFDFKYKNGNFTVESCQDFLNKPMLIKMLQKDLHLLLSEIENPKKIKTFTGKNIKQPAYKFKYKSDKYYYFYTLNNQLKKARVKESLFRSIDIHIDGYDKEIPKQITIDHLRKKLKIHLTLLKIEY